MAVPKSAQSARVTSDGTHEGFLRYANFRWLKIAAICCVVAIAAYLMVDVQPRHNGGSWLGYTLGTIGVIADLLADAARHSQKADDARARGRSRPGPPPTSIWDSALIVVGTLHSRLPASAGTCTLRWPTR